jgi:hypothetical protein
MSPETKMPSSMAGLETFSLSDDAPIEEEEVEDKRDIRDAESFFNLPEEVDATNNDEDEDDDDTDTRHKR